MHDPSKMKDASAVKLKDLHFQGRLQLYSSPHFTFLKCTDSLYCLFPLIEGFEKERERALFNKLI